MAGDPRRRVLVTGGARGMGAAIVDRLVREGYRVDFTYAASADAAHALADGLGQGTTAWSCDFADADAVDAFATALEGEPAFWGLVHNAGTTYDSLAALLDQGAATRLMQVNFWSLTRLVRALIRPMTHARAGRIVAVGSVTAERGSPGNAAYAASKAALKGYLTTLTVEVARRGVTVNTVTPGYVDTDMMKPYAALREKIEKQIPAGRFGDPRDVAAAIAFLLDPQSSYITGASLTIDGGLSAAIAVQR